MWKPKKTGCAGVGGRRDLGGGLRAGRWGWDWRSGKVCVCVLACRDCGPQAPPLRCALDSSQRMAEGGGGSGACPRRAGGQQLPKALLDPGQALEMGGGWHGYQSFRQGAVWRQVLERTLGSETAVGHPRSHRGLRVLELSLPCAQLGHRIEAAGRTGAGPFSNSM